MLVIKVSKCKAFVILNEVKDLFNVEMFHYVQHDKCFAFERMYKGNYHPSESLAPKSSICEECSDIALYYKIILKNKLNC